MKKLKLNYSLSLFIMLIFNFQIAMFYIHVSSFFFKKTIENKLLHLHFNISRIVNAYLKCSEKFIDIHHV